VNCLDVGLATSFSAEQLLQWSWPVCNGCAHLKSEGRLDLDQTSGLGAACNELAPARKAGLWPTPQIAAGPGLGSGLPTRL